MKRSKTCSRCSDIAEVQDLAVEEELVCGDCGTRFVARYSMVRHVFTRGSLALARWRRKPLVWALGEKKEIYLSCPRCTRVLKEFAHRVEDDGTVVRLRDECFECACGVHFWAYLEKWEPPVPRAPGAK